MFRLTAATRIYLYRGICDMRKSFTACAASSVPIWGRTLSGSLFVFVNRRRSMVKLLYLGFGTAWRSGINAWSGAIYPS